MDIQDWLFRLETSDRMVNYERFTDGDCYHVQIALVIKAKCPVCGTEAERSVELPLLPPDTHGNYQLGKPEARETWNDYMLRRISEKKSCRHCDVGSGIPDWQRRELWNKIPLSFHTRAVREGVTAWGAEVVQAHTARTAPDNPIGVPGYDLVKIIRRSSETYALEMRHQLFDWQPLKLSSV